MDIPRVLIAALRGGSGKTILSIGIIAALSKQGKTVAPFKKGPDYIDAGWLSLAGGRPCFNLDTFMADESAVCRSFLDHSSLSDIDIAIIEGSITRPEDEERIKKIRSRAKVLIALGACATSGGETSSSSGRPMTRTRTTSSAASRCRATASRSRTAGSTSTRSRSTSRT